MNADLLNDSQLLKNTKTLVENEREITAEILQHLEEIDRRRLYSKLKYSSIFEYCLTELGYSKAQSYRRLDAMKLARGNKQIKSEIQEGNLTLTNANQISDLFKHVELSNQEKKSIVEKASGATTQECEDVINLLKKDKGVEENKKRESKRKDGDGIRIHVTLDKKTMKKLNHLKGLLAHKKSFKTDELIDMMLDNMIETVEKKKFKSGRNNKTLVAKSRCINKETKQSRYIKKEIKDKVYKRANGKCERCNSTYALEIDHLKSFATGGENTSDNLQLLCRNCNQRKAIEEYGQSKMDLFLLKTG